MRKQFRIGWMIERLQANDTFGEVGVAIGDVGIERSLGVARSGDDHLVNALQRCRDLVEEVMIVGGVTAADGSGLVMDAPLWAVAVKIEFAAPTQREADDSGLAVVEPNDGVYLRH